MKTDPWEQRKLGDEFEFLRNNTLSRAELNDSQGTVFDVHYGDILVRFGSVIDLHEEKLPRITSSETASKLNCDVLRDGDIVIADTAEDLTAGKCSELRKVGDAKVFSGLHTIPLRPLRAYASGYLGHYLNSSAFRKQLVPLMQGVKVISLSRSSVAGTTIVMPSLREQQEIGQLFETFDHLITLRQCELVALKSKPCPHYPSDFAVEKRFQRRNQTIRACPCPFEAKLSLRASRPLGKTPVQGDIHMKKAASNPKSCALFVRNGHRRFASMEESNE